MEPTKNFEDEERAVEMVAKYTAQGDHNKKVMMMFEREERSEMVEYLQTVDSILESFRHSASLETAETTTTMVRKQLLDEFRTMLSQAFTHPPPTPSNTHHPASFNVCCSVSANYSTSVSSASLSLGELTGTLPADLHFIAQRLSAVGYLEDCEQIYKTKRLEFFDATLRQFGVQKLSAVEVKRMKWEALDKAVGLWLTALAFYVDLIPIEKQNHESIFKNHHHGDSALVMGIVRAYVSPFLDFAQAIATSHSSPHKLFRFLDLHRILKTTLRPCVLLEVPRDDPLAIQVEQVLSQLIEAAKVSFKNFERAVNSDVMHISSVKEGGVHTTTNYAMDYMIRLISEYSDECEWIVSAPRKVEVSTRINGNICEKKTIDGSGVSPFASHVIWVIASLLRRLKSKTVQHQDDDAFAHFFMMNNLNYIVQTVNEQPSLREMVGGDFLRDLETDLRARKLKYLGSTWTKIVQNLAQCSSPKKIKLFNVTLSRQSSRKEALRNFNEMFNKVHQTQSRWSGSDANLMRQLRNVILERLVPTYEHLLDQLSDASGNPTTEIQYSVEDLKKAISQLFQGRPPTR